ncbi:MAG: DegT/DnrJ/EryC1/StrS family aminotransferase [Treponema sp.]|nr:DegT/DnrJ/EryC1/StrS family aminotransferase [Treponema sp.]
MANTLKVPFSKPSITKEEEDAVLKVIRSGWLTTGNESLMFEKEFSQFLSRPIEGAEIYDSRPLQSLAVNSNTSGMILAMYACGVKAGTWIITTPYTFVSTAACARHLGADVLFADIEKDTYNIDPDNIEKLIKENPDKKIAAIVPVHIAGTICNMERIMDIARKYNIKVIEDAAHSFPCPTKLGYAGTIGDAGVFSFYATKPLTTAEGGMVCCRDPQMVKTMTVMRLHGMDRTTWDRYTSPRASWEYDIVAPGYKFNLPDILSAFGRVQLSHSDSFNEKRKAICNRYNQAFKDLDTVELPPDCDGNCWHLYLLRIKPQNLTISRNEFAQKLQESGIGISMHFIPLFHFTYWKELYKDFTAENYPNAQDKYSRTITLPLWPDMTDEMICDTIKEVKRISMEYHK